MYGAFKWLYCSRRSSLLISAVTCFPWTEINSGLKSKTKFDEPEIVIRYIRQTLFTASEPILWDWIHFTTINQQRRLLTMLFRALKAHYSKTDCRFATAFFHTIRWTFLTITSLFFIEIDIEKHANAGLLATRFTYLLVCR